MIYQAKVTKNGIKDPPIKVCKEPNIVKNYLIKNNQATLTKYQAILKPFQIAIKLLKERLKKGIYKLTLLIFITR